MIISIARSILKFVVISWHYKIAFISFLLRCLCYLPFFSYDLERVKDTIDDHISSEGHIKPGKKIRIKIFNFTIIKLYLKKSEALTAEHFYFHRSNKDIKFLIKSSKKKFKIKKNSIIFDPACGTGKQLSYICDRYNCRGIGIDIYPPAISVAKKIEKFTNCIFLCESSLDTNTLSSLYKYFDSKKINILLINSWIDHVCMHKDFDIFLDYVKNIKCKIMIIEPKKIDLKAVFKTDKILYQSFKDKVQYAILEL
jgi:hypothetical protein|tara:strand:- start:82 stop:843 length:762 start_codon:yes stop_codon:yes gene_type:complete